MSTTTQRSYTGFANRAIEQLPGQRPIQPLDVLASDLQGQIEATNANILALLGQNVSNFYYNNASRTATFSTDTKEGTTATVNIDLEKIGSTVRLSFNGFMLQPGTTATYLEILTTDFPAWALPAATHTFPIEVLNDGKQALGSIRITSGNIRIFPEYSASVWIAASPSIGVGTTADLLHMTTLTYVAA